MASKPHNIRTRLFKEQRGLCYYCARPMALLKLGEKDRAPSNLATLDHIIPLAKGGARGPTINCVCACKKCNNERGTRDARLFLLEKMGLHA